MKGSRRSQPGGLHKPAKSSRRAKRCPRVRRQWNNAKPRVVAYSLFYRRGKGQTGRVWLTGPQALNRLANRARNIRWDEAPIPPRPKFVPKGVVLEAPGPKKDGGGSTGSIW